MRSERKNYVLNKPIPDVPKSDASAEVITERVKHIQDELDVQNLMVGIMVPDLQRRFMETRAYDMCEMLKKMFQEQARVERYKVTKSLLSHKMAEGSSISSHMLRMTSDVEQLEKLNCPLSKELATDIILNSLPSSYSGFIMNFHMHGMDKSLQELQGMLRTAEGDMKKGSHVLMIQEGGRKIKKAKGKKAQKYKGKGKSVVQATTPKIKVYANSDCYYCNGKGHWKRNCPKYLADLKVGNVPHASGSGMTVIEINVATSLNDWVLDTGSCAHICSNVKTLKIERKLSNREV